MNSTTGDARRTNIATIGLVSHRPSDPKVSIFTFRILHLIVDTGFVPPKRSDLPDGSLLISKPYGAAEILAGTFSKPGPIVQQTPSSLVPIIGDQKTNGTICKLFRIADAALGQVEDALSHYFAHCSCISWARAFASGLP
jgi:hypothetical protein